MFLFSCTFVELVRLFLFLVFVPSRVSLSIRISIVGELIIFFSLSPPHSRLFRSIRLPVFIFSWRIVGQTLEQGSDLPVHWRVKSLLQASRHVGDLFEDLRDGYNLISLLEVLSGEHLVSIPLGWTIGALFRSNVCWQGENYVRIGGGTDLAQTPLKPIATYMYMYIYVYAMDGSFVFSNAVRIEKRSIKIRVG